MPAARPPLRRVLLKLSGEMLAGGQSAGLDPAVLRRMAEELQAARRAGAEIAVVVGGGNFFRGAEGEALGIDRATGDQMGMLSTVANGLALRSAFEGAGLAVTVQSAIPIPGVVPGVDPRAARAALEAGEVVVFVAGTGNPYFTTDTAAALRAVQIAADAMIKGTKVDGVYAADPVTHPGAERFDVLSYQEVLARQLGVMDLAATALCASQGLPVIVFDLHAPGALARVIRGEPVGTLVTASPPDGAA